MVWGNTEKKESIKNYEKQIVMTVVLHRVLNYYDLFIIIVNRNYETKLLVHSF